MSTPDEDINPVRRFAPSWFQPAASQFDRFTTDFAGRRIDDLVTHRRPVLITGDHESAVLLPAGRYNELLMFEDAVLQRMEAGRQHLNPLPPL